MTESDKDQSIARLLDDSQEMIRRFEDLVGKDKVEQISAEVQRETLENLEDSVEPAADAWFNLFVEEDAMTVVAEFRPPAGGGKPLDLERIEQALQERGVTHGILWEAVRQGLDGCNLERKVLADVIVARGTPPVPFVPQHVKLDDRLTAHTLPAQADQVHDVDFKEISPFILVKQGELLAVRIADAYGSHGTDVLGREVPYPTESPPTWTPGANVIDTPAGFEAGLDGRLELMPPSFGVNPILELKEGVNYKTGNIRFRGEVIVHGKVAAGFAVEATGGLTCHDTLDAFQVKVGTDLVTPGGVIGNGDGRVEVGREVKVKFLEHVYLLAQGDVAAETGVLNSVVKTRGKLVLGEKGILAGGEVHCLNGVDLFQIGTATGPRTELFVGLDFQGMERITWIRDRSQELHAQLKKVDAAIPYGGTRVQELMAAAKKLRVEIVQLTENARNQLMHLGQNEAAQVAVRGAVYPGTLVAICHVQFLVTEKMSAVRFFLDKRKGIVSVEPLGDKTRKDATPSGHGSKKH